MIKIGELVPNFTLPASNGEEVSLHDFHGKKVIVYFYPKDMTPGCTTQACDFRDQHEQYADKNAIVLGISADPIDMHNRFIEKYSLPFLLLTDEKHEALQLFDVWKEKQMFGKTYMGIERSTFLIDEKGRLVQEWRKVKVADHVAEVLEAVTTLA